MKTATESKTIRLDVELPDIGEKIADVFESYLLKIQEVFPDGAISSEIHAKTYTRSWLDMEFERAERIHNKREYELNLTKLPSVNSK